MNEIEWYFEHWVPREIKYADCIGMLMQNHGYGFETPPGKVNVFKIVEGQFLFLKEAA